MEAGSPRLSEITAKMPGNPDSSYKRLQRFLQDNDPQATPLKGIAFSFHFCYYDAERKQRLQLLVAPINKP